MTELDVSQMTPEQRLKQIEILLSTAAKKITENAEGIQELKEQNSLLNLQLTRLSQLLTDTITTIARSEERTNRQYQEHQAEIERIWQYLMSRSGNGNSSP